MSKTEAGRFLGQALGTGQKWVGRGGAGGVREAQGGARPCSALPHLGCPAEQTPGMAEAVGPQPQGCREDRACSKGGVYGGEPIPTSPGATVGVMDPRPPHTMSGQAREGPADPGRPWRPTCALGGHAAGPPRRAGSSRGARGGRVQARHTAQATRCPAPGEASLQPALRPKCSARSGRRRGWQQPHTLA